MANHPWLRSYPVGLDWTASVAVMPVSQILDDAVAKWGDRPAIDFMGRKIAYRELGALVERGAKGRPWAWVPAAMSASICRTRPIR
jgi:long-chain acyl-CoA synthetase